MGKPLFRFLFLLIGTAGIAYGGYFIYQKQYFPVSHESFETEDSEQLFVADIEQLKSKTSGLELLKSYGADYWSDWLEVLSENILSKESISIQLNRSLKQNTMSICGLPKGTILNFPDIEIMDNRTINFKGKTWYYWENDLYFVISDKVVKPKKTRKLKPPYYGNADFFFKDNDGIVEAIKLSDNVKFSAYISEEELLKGKPVKPFQLLSNCPATARKIRYFGSSRYASDVKTLQHSNNVFDQSWIDNEMAYIEKDSFELIIARQSDEQQLENLIKEAVIGSSQDALMKPSVYLNNTEIIPFNINWDWQKICHELKSDMHYFAAFNNYVFLANNLQAMYWILTNIQLGKTFDNYELAKKIPSQINTLDIDYLDQGMIITAKTWINQKRSINLSSITDKVTRTNDSRLIADFANVSPTKWLLAFEDESVDQHFIVAVNGKAIDFYNLEGEKAWHKEFDNEITIAPILLEKSIGENNNLVVVQGKSAIVISTDNGQILNNFNLSTSSNIKKIQPITEGKMMRFIIKTETGILICDEKGEPNSGHKQSRILGKTAAFFHQIINGQNILLLQSIDSIFIINPISETLLGAKENFTSTGKMAPFLTLNSNQYQIMTYDDGYIKMHNFNQLGLDSLELDKVNEESKSVWVKSKKWLLGVETYDQMRFYNTLGLIEFELRKPEPNIEFINGVWTENGIFPFLNTQTKELYFLDFYGNLLLKTPIVYDYLLTTTKNYIINKSQNRFHVYKVF